MKMYVSRRAIVLTACSLFFASAAQTPAIVLNDQYFANSGGDPADVAGTLDAGYAMARAYSVEPQFHALGALGICTGTWIGNDLENDKSFFLTAAHCFESNPPTLSRQIAASWLATSTAENVNPADLNVDGVVNLLDWRELTAEFAASGLIISLEQALATLRVAEPATALLAALTVGFAIGRQRSCRRDAT